MGNTLVPMGWVRTRGYYGLTTWLGALLQHAGIQ